MTDSEDLIEYDESAAPVVEKNDSETIEKVLRMRSGRNGGKW